MKKLTLIIGLYCSFYLAAQEKYEFKIQTGHAAEITSVSFSSNGKFILTSSGDKTAKLWDFTTGKVIRSFNGSSEYLSNAMFCNGEKNIFVGGFEKNARVFDVKTGIEVQKFKCYGSSLNPWFALSPDDRFAFVPFNSSPKLIDLATGKEIRTIGNMEPVSAAFSPDCKKLVLGYNSKVIIYDPLTGNEIKTVIDFSGLGDIRYQKLVYCKNGNFLGIFDGYSQFKIFDSIYNSNVINSDIQIESAAFSNDGKYLLVGGMANNKADAKVFDISNSANLNTKPLFGFNSHKGRKVKAVEFSWDNKYAITGSDDNEAIIWDMTNGKVNKVLKGEGIKPIVAASISPDNRFLITGAELNAYGIKSDEIQQARLWDIQMGKVIKYYEKKKDDNNLVAFSSDNHLIAFGGYNGNISVTDFNGNKLKLFKTEYSSPVTSIQFSADNNYLFVGTISEMAIYEISTGKKMWSYDKLGTGHTVYFNLSSDNTFMVTFTQNNYTAILWKLVDGSKIKYKKIKEFNPVESASIGNENKYLFTGGSYFDVQVWDIATLKPIKKIMPDDSVTTGFDISNPTWYNVNVITVSKDNKLIAIAANQLIKLFEIETGKLIKTFTGHSDNVTVVQFSKDDSKLITSSKDGSIRIWNIADDSWTAFVSNSEQWIAYTNDGYWDSSSKGGELIAMIEGMNCWNIDQFAVRNNRPDIIAERMGANIEFVSHLKNQYLKRLKKFKLTEADLNSNLEAPNVVIIGIDQSDKFVTFRFKLSDSNNKLKQYNIYLNDVPIFSSQGKSLNEKIADISEKIEITSGENKIEVSCINVKGVESYRAVTYVQYDKQVKSNLYLLALGVSKYQNPAYNLQFADKDALDLSKVIETYKGKGFENVYTKVLTNEQVTPEAIKAAKEFVKNAKPDDTFILFIAGHGMHDTDPEATYYYLTYGADIKNLKATAADFETIEDLLQGIPPRNKLFLMDACESGEIDDEDQGQMLATATGAGINSRGFKSVTTQTSASSAPPAVNKRAYLYQKDRYIYNDLVRRSGAIVFSSSKGGELSYERSDIENGLFTEYIMKALTTTEADKDNNGIVSTDELRQYVSEQVAKASGDLQHPTVDRDNIYQKFGFGVK